MALPSLLHPYNELLTLKSAFPVRCEMLVESDEILWCMGGGVPPLLAVSSLFSSNPPRFTPHPFGLQFTPKDASL